MWADMMDVLEARDTLKLINIARAGQGDDKKNASYMHDLRARARLRDPWDGEAQKLDMDGTGLSQVSDAFSTDEAYIDDDDWFGAEEEL